MSTTVIVPTRNEAPNVEPLVRRVVKAFHGEDLQIIFVDDSDADDPTPDNVRRAARTASADVSVLHREPGERAGGLGGAVLAGLKVATSDWVVVMDGDLQHPPEVAPLLVTKGRLTDADVVVASRYIEGGGSDGLANALRHVVSSATTRLARGLFPRRLRTCSDPMSGFFAVRREAIDLGRLRPRGFKILLEILARTKLIVAEVPFTFAERHAGESKAHFREGMRFVQQVMQLRCGPALLFALVGLTGVLPNLVAVALLSATGMHYLIAAFLATQVAILWNLVGAELVVFRDRRVGMLWHRALRYIAISNTDLLRLPFVGLLVSGLGVGVVLATALTLLLAFSLRYVLTSRLIYGAREAPVPVAVPSNAGLAADAA